MRAFLGPVAMLVFAMPCLSQGNAEVVHAKPVRVRQLAGTVVDPAGMTVEYAKVELRDPTDHHVRASTFADAKGNFAFPDHKRGEWWEVEILANGFHPTRYTVRLVIWGREKLRARVAAAS
jgi:hypothetical protein